MKVLLLRQGTLLDALGAKQKTNAYDMITALPESPHTFPYVIIAIKELQTQLMHLKPYIMLIML